MTLRPPLSDPRPILLLAAALLLVAAVLAVISDGVYQDDSLTHYLMARWSWDYPKYLADDWGRPGFTVPYALVSNLGSPRVGFAMARLMTVAIVGFGAWLAYRVARGALPPETRGISALAAVAVVAMPLNFTMSFDTLTEPVAALYVAGGTYLMLRDRTRWAALAFSLVPITRHEGAALLPVIALLLAWRRDWLAIPLLLVGEVAWNFGKPLLGYPMKELPIYRFIGGDDPGHLGVGGPLHYVMGLGEAVGPAMLGLVIVGIGVLLTMSWRRLRTGYDPVGIAQFLCGGGTAAMLLLQTLLYMFNTHESGGYARFLLPAAPWMAVCVAAAVAWLLAQRSRRAIALAAGAMLLFLFLASIEARRQGFPPYWGWPKWFAWLAPMLLITLPLLLRPTPARVRTFLRLAAVVAALTWLGVVQPNRLATHSRLVGEVMAAYASDPRYADHLIVGDNPWTHYYSNRPVPPGGTWAPNDWHRDPPPNGLLYLWDRHHSSVNLPLSELAQRPHRQLPIPETPTRRKLHPDDPNRHFLLMFERLATAQ